MDLKSNAWGRLRQSRRSHAWFMPDLLLWLSFGLLYAGTTALDVLPADAGEFQLVAASWGIAHPPGYPLYSLLAWLWTHLVPIGPVPFRTNLFSALLGACALWLTYRAVVTWVEFRGHHAASARIGGLIAALTLGSATTFWHQATTANIRMFTVLFTAWGFLALARYARTAHEPKARTRALYTLAVATGLGIGHHPSLAFITVGWLLGLILYDPRLVVEPRRWWRAAFLTVIAWVLPQLLLPLRDSMRGVPLAPGDLATWHGFWDHILARGFGGDMFAYASVTDLRLRLPLLPSLFRMQFPIPVLVLMIASGIGLLITFGKLGIVLLTIWLIHSFVTITYRAPQTVEYLMPAYVPMVIAFGVTIAGVEHWGRRNVKRSLQSIWRTGTILLTALLLLRLLAQVDDFAILSVDTSVRDRTAPLLETAESEALILADWRWATPLWTLQRVEGKGPGVDVTYVVPERETTYEEVWRGHVERAGSRPIYSTHRYSWEAWSFTPIGGGYRLAKRPALTVPQGFEMMPLNEDLGPLHVLGYRWVGNPSPGRTIELQIAWRATDLEPPNPSLTARLWDTETSLLAAKDKKLDTALVEGEVQVTSLPLQMPLDRCDHVASPTLGAYVVEDGDFLDLGSTSLPPLAVDCNYPKLPTRKPLVGWVSNQGPLLRGVDYHAQGEESALIFLHWCGPGPGLILTSGVQSQRIVPLPLGACQTTAMTTPLGQRPALKLTYPGGQEAKLISLPLPIPRPGDRYLPFGDRMVLIDSELTTREGSAILDLTWLTTNPIVTDYAVSVRLHDEAGTWIGMHDMQPGLGAIPTLKWVSRGLTILDPHPFDLSGTSPAYASLVVYERYRLTSLSSTEGEISTLSLPDP